jgi:thiamine pyrophosphokinase
LRLDALVGDFDSTSPEQAARLAADGTQLVRRPAEKDETDLELALLHAFEEGVDEAIVVGAAGSRIDMTVADVLLLLHPSLVGRRISLWVGSQTAYLRRPPGGAIDGAAGDTVSLIPLGGDARGVTTHGLAFPLNGETLGSGPARGVSNRITTPPARVELASGALLVVHTPRESFPEA